MKLARYLWKLVTNLVPCIKYNIRDEVNIADESSAQD